MGRPEELAEGALGACEAGPDRAAVPADTSVSGRHEARGIGCNGLFWIGDIGLISLDSRQMRFLNTYFKCQALLDVLPATSEPVDWNLGRLPAVRGGVKCSHGRPAGFGCPPAGPLAGPPAET